MTVNFDECVGMLQLRYVDANGQPVAVSNASGQANDDFGVRSYLYEQLQIKTDNYLAVPSDRDLTVYLNVKLGKDVYKDEITYAFSLKANVGCDEIQDLDVVIGPASELGRITGIVDMEGEFELTTEGYPPTGLLGRTWVRSDGPAGNRRWDFVAGNNVDVPASGPFELENLLPSNAVDPAQTWRVYTEMHFRRDRKFEYFVSPILGDGTHNPGVTVEGGTVELNDFDMKPAYLKAKSFWRVLLTPRRRDPACEVCCGRLLGR